MQMVNTALGWYLYELTSDVLSQSWLGLSEVIPAIGLALYAGHIIDISNKRKLMVRTIFLFFLAGIGLTVATSGLPAQGYSVRFTVTLIYTLVFFTGVFRSFTGPSFSAILAQLLQRSHLEQGVTYSTTAWQLAAISGPIVAGMLIHYQGITTMFYVAVCSVFIAWLCMMRLPNLPSQHGNRAQPTWDSVLEGIRFVWTRKEVLGAISLDMFAVLFGGAVAMLPVFAKDILHVGANGLGLLKAAQGIGTVAILFWMIKKPLRYPQGKLLHICIAGFGLCMIGFALSRFFWLSFIILIVSGMFDGVSINIRGAIMQLYVPDELRGRVSSVNSMFINSSNELGQVESGIAAKLMGTVPSILFGGCMTILVVLISWMKAPALKKLKY